MTPEEIIDCIRDISSGKSSKHNVMEILRAHKCYALISLTDKTENKIERYINAVTIKERYKMCHPIFEQDTIPYAVIKGAVLSNTVYNDPFLRYSGDIDILIDRADADRMKALLETNGFVQGRITESGIVPFSRSEILYQTAMSHQTAPYVKQTGNKLCPYINLDVNMNIFWGESDEKANMNSFLSFREKSELFGVQLYKLTPEAEFISLCLHHYKDMNSLYLLSRGSLRLGLFCDIHDYLKNVKPDVEKLSEMCDVFNTGKYVYVCLHYTEKIFGDGISGKYLDFLDKYRDYGLINTFGLSEKERKNWDISLFERLFHPNLPEYVFNRLTTEEKEKVEINKKMM